MEGNTRTTAVFMECYLTHLGFPVDNEMFKEYSKYFRRALVRANYAVYLRGIVESDEYLIRFYTNLLTEDKTVLRSRDLILEIKDKWGVRNLFNYDVIGVKGKNDFVVRYDATRSFFLI